MECFFHLLLRVLLVMKMILSKIALVGAQVAGNDKRNVDRVELG